MLRSWSRGLSLACIAVGMTASMACTSEEPSPTPQTETTYVVISYVADPGEGAFVGSLGELPAQVVEDLVSEQTRREIAVQLVAGEQADRHADEDVSDMEEQLRLSEVGDPYQAIAVAATNDQGDRLAAEALANEAAERVAAIARAHPLLAASALPTDVAEVSVTVTPQIQ